MTKIIMTKEDLIKICEEVGSDVENDAKEFDSKPFTGKVVAQYFGYHGAAIKALADIIKEILRNDSELQKKVYELEHNYMALQEKLQTTDFKIKKIL